MAGLLVLLSACAEAPPQEQPVPFSHKQHAGDLGIHCRYCHSRAEISRVANVPSVARCTGCHAGVKEPTEPMRALDALGARGEPIPWVRVGGLPDHVRFDHGAHVRSRIDCVECHGEVERMERVTPVRAMTMGWCVACHMERGAGRDCLVCHQ